MGNLTKRFVYLINNLFTVYKKNIRFHISSVAPCGTDNTRYNFADIMYAILWKSAQFGLETFFSWIIAIFTFYFLTFCKLAFTSI